MRIAVKDFSVAPSTELRDRTSRKRSDALQQPRHHRDRDRAATPKTSRRCAKKCWTLSDNYNKLVQQQRILGFDEKACARPARCRQRDRTRHQRKHDVARRGRRNEADDGAAAHAATRSRLPAQSERDLARQEFLAGYKQFTDIFANIDGTPEMKGALEQQVKAYADTFAQWVDVFDRTHPLRR